jgi:hypothetical protein
MTTRFHALARTTLPLALTALALAACGDDGGGSSAPETVEVTAIDFAFQDLPAAVPPGTRLTLANAADHELHELVAIRLDDAETRPVADLVALPPAELQAALAGQPATVLLAAPGGDVIPAVGDGTLSEPGRYAVICMIPTGADPQTYLEAAATSDGPPQVAGGPPHLVNGMWAEITVG